ncbi:MAG: hypothetical protein R2738_04985 [Bacteroides graminisolvens]
MLLLNNEYNENKSNINGLPLMGITAACSNDDKPQFPEEPQYDMSGFAKGADVSWLTEMEKSGSKFYNADGKMKCMTTPSRLGSLLHPVTSMGKPRQRLVQ